MHVRDASEESILLGLILALPMAKQACNPSAVAKVCMSAQIFLGIQSKAFLDILHKL